jgi:gas vesicle protein
MEALKFMSDRMIKNETDWAALLANEDGKTERLKNEIASLEGEREKLVQASEGTAYWDKEKGKLIETEERLSQIDERLAGLSEQLQNHEKSVQSHRKLRDSYLKYTTDTAYSSLQEKAAQSR